MHPSVSSNALTQYMEASTSSIAAEGSSNTGAGSLESPIIGEDSTGDGSGAQDQEGVRTDEDEREEVKGDERVAPDVDGYKEEDEGGGKQRGVDSWHGNKSDPSWPLVSTTKEIQIRFF